MKYNKLYYHPTQGYISGWLYADNKRYESALNNTIVYQKHVKNYTDALLK